MARADELFPVEAYRGLMDEPVEPQGWQWFSDKPEIANTYAQNPRGANVIPARINPGKALEVDAGGEVYTTVPINDLPDEVRKIILRSGSSLNDRYGVSTDRIAGAALQSGYDSVIFRNVRDAKTGSNASTPVSTVYAVMRPENVRSRFAQFDPERADVAEWLAGLGVAVPVGGGLLSRVRRERDARA